MYLGMTKNSDGMAAPVAALEPVAVEETAVPVAALEPVAVEEPAAPVEEE